VWTGKYLPIFRRPYLTLSSGTSSSIFRDKQHHLQGQAASSSGTSTLMFRAKKNHCRVRAVQELYCLILNMNRVCSSETSAKISQLRRRIILKTYFRGMSSTACHHNNNYHQYDHFLCVSPKRGELIIHKLPCS